jgi:hypothetical protein
MFVFFDEWLQTTPTKYTNINLGFPLIATGDFL